MKVQVKLYGSLSRFSQPETPGVWLGEVPMGWSLRDLMHRIGIPEKEVWIGAINGSACPLETEIPEGANVTLVTARGSGG